MSEILTTLVVVGAFAIDYVIGSARRLDAWMEGWAAGWRGRRDVDEQKARELLGEAGLHREVPEEP
jgi:hypothetical protein